MTAAKTSLPVLGVPVQSKALNGLDSLLSIVQMPAGVPVATFAIGAAGATNAALLRRRDPRQQAPGHRQRSWSLPRHSQTASVLDQSRSAHAAAHDRRHRGRRPARPHARFGRLSAGPGFPVPGSGRAMPRPASVAPVLHGAFTDRELLDAPGAALRSRSPFDWENVSVRGLAGTRRRARRAHLPADSSRWRPRRTASREAPVRAAEDSDHALAGGELPRPTRRAPSATSACPACSRPAASATTARARRWCARRPTRSGPGSNWARAPLIYEELVPFDCEVSIIGARSRSGEIAIYPLNGNRPLARHPASDARPLRPRALAPPGRQVPAARADALPLHRHSDDRVLRARRPADRQRDGAPRAQLRTLDHRRCRHQPVREPPAGHPGPAPGSHPARRLQRHGQPDRQHAAARAQLLAPATACTCTTMARNRARAASSAIAPWWSHSAARAATARRIAQGWLAGFASLRSGRRERPSTTSGRRARHVPRTVQTQGTAVPAQPGPAVPVSVQTACPRQGVHGVDDLVHRRLRGDHRRDRLGQDHADRVLPEGSASGRGGRADQPDAGLGDRLPAGGAGAVRLLALQDEEGRADRHAQQLPDRAVRRRAQGAADRR